MVSVDNIFHQAALIQSPETRIRLYWIDSTIDCTDDNDVQTNGTLLKRVSGDTDSCGRISIGGVNFSETFTKDEDWTIGNCVSNTVSLSLLNDDGGLSSCTYGRCKIYLDVKGVMANQLVNTNTQSVTVPSGHKTYSVLVGTKTIATSDGTPIPVVGNRDKVVDLTVWFGSGNEPATLQDAKTAEVEQYLLHHPGYTAGTVATGSWWHTCPMGVYYISAPVKRMAKTISVIGYDEMQNLDAYADDWWDSLNFENGITLANILSSMATELGVSLKPGMSIVNGSHTYTSAPFLASSTSFRTILANLSGAACSNARFDRNGYLELKWFPNTACRTYASIFNADVSEYEVSAVTALEIRGSEMDVGVAVGESDDNTYIITDNPFLYGSTEAEITPRATAIKNKMVAFPDFHAASVYLHGDWSVEAGDVVQYTIGSTTYSLPIFQQRLNWKGGYVSVEMDCSGSETRPLEKEDTKVSLTQYKDRKTVHEIENTITLLRSVISDTEGNVSSLQQTSASIIASVASLNSSVQSILDPTGEMWTFMNNLSSTVTANNDSTEAQFDNISSYIRFINGNIVLGKSDSAIKLKIMPDAMMFYSGDDSVTSLNNAIAYFTYEQFFESVIKSADYVQIGTNSTTNYQWVKRSNGHVTLWRV